LEIEGIQVAFPYQPYACQQDYMRTALVAVRDASHALLESPTGTGKTLCLLCALLGWQQAVKASVQCHVPVDVDTVRDKHTELKAVKSKIEQSTSNASSEVPIIYYASRTHSQLSQVVRELKKTAYAPKMVVLGSREQSCLHEKVNKITNRSAQAAICNRLCSKGKCKYKLKVDEAIGEFSKLSLTERVMDLEELGVFSKRLSACPFFTSRDILAGAELVLLPYNYILDSRLGLPLNLKNAVVIIDEAHNIEGFCSDIFSFEILSDEFLNAHGELSDLEQSLLSGMGLPVIEGETIDIATVAKMSVQIAAIHQLFISIPFDSNHYFSSDGRKMLFLLESIGVLYICLHVD
jgi:regulator of telomere elongation helicase 1